MARGSAKLQQIRSQCPAASSCSMRPRGRDRARARWETKKESPGGPARRYPTRRHPKHFAEPSGGRQRAESRCDLSKVGNLGLQRTHLRGHGALWSRVDCATTGGPLSGALRFSGGQTPTPRPDVVSGGRCQSRAGAGGSSSAPSAPAYAPQLLPNWTAAGRWQRTLW